MVKLVYTYALGAYASRRAGSSPVSGTNQAVYRKAAAMAVFIALIAILCRKDCELLWDIDILHNTAIIEVYSDTGNSNGEIPKKNPFFCYLFFFLYSILFFTSGLSKKSTYLGVNGRYKEEVEWRFGANSLAKRPFSTRYLTIL